MKRIFAYGLAVLCAASLIGGSAAAQPANSSAAGADVAVDDTGGEDILVTARRREESLQKVPVAVTRISSEELRDRLITRPIDIAILTPGLVANPNASNRNDTNFAIRGQGGNFFAGGSGVATYTAEVPDFGTQIFDLESVQVLKGPQGTLFGRVTTGGAVLLAPRAPAGEFEGYIKTRIGRFRSRELEFGVSAPVVEDVLSLRIAGVHRGSRGFTRNVFDGNYADSINNSALRVTSLLNLGRLKNKTIYQYARNAEDQRASFLTFVQPFGTTNVRGNLRPIPRSIATAAGIACNPTCPTWMQFQQQTLANQSGRSKQEFVEQNDARTRVTEFQGVINSTDFDLSENITLRNIFSYKQINGIKSGDTPVGDSSILPILDLHAPAGKENRGLTEEFQVQANFFDSRLELTAGGYYEHNWQPTYQRSINMIFGGFSTSSASVSQAACLPPNEFSDGLCHMYSGYAARLSKFDFRDKALYGQAVIAVTDRFKLTGGYRHTFSDRQTLAGSSQTSLGLALPGALPSIMYQMVGAKADRIPAEIVNIPGVVPTVLEADKGTYTVAADYQITQDLLVYATRRTGYKPGGFNPVAPAGRQQFGPETVTNHEVGLKTNWQFGEVSGRTNVALFRDNYQDIQRTITDTVAGVATTFTSNAAKARIQGIELDASAMFWDTLEFNGYYAFTDAKYLRYPNTGQFPGFPAGVDVTSMLLANAAKHRWGITPAVHFNGLDANLPDIRFSANIYYQSRTSQADVNIPVEPNNIIPGRTLIDARLDWRSVAGGSLSLAVGATNLANHQGPLLRISNASITGTGYEYYFPPRAYYIELNYDF